MTADVLPRILLVEDSRRFRELVVEILREKGYKVRGARSIRKVIHRLKNHQFDLIISDISVGDKSGAEVVKLVADTYPDAKIIMMSLPIADPIIEEAMASGRIYFLPKPFGANQLLEMLTSISNAPQSTDEPK